MHGPTPGDTEKLGAEYSASLHDFWSLFSLLAHVLLLVVVHQEFIPTSVRYLKGCSVMQHRLIPQASQKCSALVYGLGFIRKGVMDRLTTCLCFFWSIFPHFWHFHLLTERLWVNGCWGRINRKMLSETSEIISPAGVTGTALQTGYFFALWCFSASTASLVRCWVCMLRKLQIAQPKQGDSQRAVSLIHH